MPNVVIFSATDRIKGFLQLVSGMAIGTAYHERIQLKTGVALLSLRHSS